MPAERTCKDCGERFSCWTQHWTSNASSARCRCRPCYNAYMLRRHHARRAANPERYAEVAKRRREGYEPTGASVDCMMCGTTFQRACGRMTCSDACRDQARRERYRRKNRRRRTGSAPGDYTLAEVASRDGHRCHLCGRKVDMGRSGMAKWGPTIDHIVPLSDHGLDTAENVALAHRDCNIRRQAGGFAQLRLVG